MHGVDAGDLQASGLDSLFDRVVWNFPCLAGRCPTSSLSCSHCGNWLLTACVAVPAGQDGQNAQMDANKQLVRPSVSCD